MIGTTVSHYTILEKLGGGGMGVVYKARDTRLNRVVALKFLPPNLTQDEQSKKRFIQEAQAASSLQHPAICTIHDIDETKDGQLFIVMECYDGETLKQRLQRGPLAIEDVENLAAQMAQGLLKAHESGIIHRDLKSANVMITGTGSVKIIDFGLAKLLGAGSITKTGTTHGTISYMCPEQIRGGKIDHRCDLWSFGVLLYEMVTGVLPFASEFEQATMYRIISDSYAPVASLRPDAPQHLVDLIDRCLKKDETERLASMADALKLLGHVPGSTHLPHGLRATGSWGGRILRLAPILVIGVLLALYFLPRIFAPPPSTLTIAVLCFQNQTNDENTTTWPFKVQEFLSEGLTGLKDVAVKHYNYLNDVVQSSFGVADFPRGARLTTLLRKEQVDYYLDGAILKESQKYSLHAFLVDARNSQQLQSFDAQCDSEADLADAAGKLADQLVSYLSSEILKSDDDLKVWKERRPKNWKAVSEFTEASEFILNGQPGGPKLERAVELDSTFISPRVWLIPSLIGAKKIAEAKQHYEYLLRLKPGANSFESAMISWVGAYLARDYDRQAYYLRLALLSSKDNRILLHNLADAEQTLGHYRAAVDVMQPCLQTRWRYAPMYRIVGECLLKLQDVWKAKSILTDALTNAWVDIRVAPMLTAVYKKEGDEVNAAHFRRKALDEYKERTGAYGLAYERIAGYLTDVGMLDSAGAEIQKALDENPRVASHHFQYADILFRQGRFADAEQHCYQTMMLDSTFGRTHFLLGEIFDKMGDRSDAVRQYNQFLAFDSTSSEAQITRQALSRIQR